MRARRVSSGWRRRLATTPATPPASMCFTSRGRGEGGREEGGREGGAMLPPSVKAQLVVFGSEDEEEEAAGEEGVNGNAGAAGRSA